MTAMADITMYETKQLYSQYIQIMINYENLNLSCLSPMLMVVIVIYFRGYSECFGTA